MYFENCVIVDADAVANASCEQDLMDTGTIYFVIGNKILRQNKSQ